MRTQLCTIGIGAGIVLVGFLVSGGDGTCDAQERGTLLGPKTNSAEQSLDASKHRKFLQDHLKTKDFVVMTTDEGESAAAVTVHSESSQRSQERYIKFAVPPGYIRAAARFAVDRNDFDDATATWATSDPSDGTVYLHARADGFLGLATARVSNVLAVKVSFLDQFNQWLRTQSKSRPASTSADKPTKSTKSRSGD